MITHTVILSVPKPAGKCHARHIAEAELDASGR